MLLDLLARHGLGDELIETGSEAQAIEATTDAVRLGYDVVVGAGGDGTIGLVGRHLLGSGTALGILPLGSIMNIPRMLGMTRDLEDAARILAAGHERSVDVGRYGDRIFFETATVGMHAAVSRDLPMLDHGDYGAINRSIEAALSYRPSTMWIELEGDRVIETQALVVVIANGPYMGPGLTVAPEAELDDGLFDVRVFTDYTKPELARYLASVAFGRRADEQRSLTERASRVRVTGPRPLPVRADAEFLGTTPVSFEIRPRVLTVVAPDPSASPSGSDGPARAS